MRGKNFRKEEAPRVSQSAGHSGEVRAEFLSMVAIYDLDRNSFDREDRQRPDQGGFRREWKKTIEDRRDGQLF